MHHEHKHLLVTCPFASPNPNFRLNTEPNLSMLFSLTLPPIILPNTQLHPLDPASPCLQHQPSLTKTPLQSLPLPAQDVPTHPRVSQMRPLRPARRVRPSHRGHLQVLPVRPRLGPRLQGREEGEELRQLEGRAIRAGGRLLPVFGVPG